MRVNAFFPTRDIGSDPVKIRDWAQAAEDLGYATIEVADHVFGAAARDRFNPLYNETDGRGILPTPVIGVVDDYWTQDGTYK